MRDAKGVGKYEGKKIIKKQKSWQMPAFFIA
jgi:hypothetical protein